MSERHLFEMDPDEAWKLLAEAPVGRLVFNHRSLPAIRPVNHLVFGGQILIRTRLDSRVSAAVAERVSPGIVVAYEVDELDAETRSGWSVVAVGKAEPVDDPDLLARVERELRPWVERDTDAVIGIRPEIITGYRIAVED
ncbi:pyridoxamine 5'-phosphate oxidase family protein [Glycomyces sp. YM15]|uniref:pyridoxamine 5'-phosphate oxidase family protein n=1 Tax=Glycomyces sp. YM15 TaxID=2800446 RepID=UPI0019639CB0|nr:pyridoxamine 5'-phosphate oxidase family protein [Glycomyces sp. YM15]